ncbi:MAG TPA: hypothetical protein VJ773_00030, partial [Gemmatimonadales bacterium]|nr:hypothetical protein [Gemmatimonadales bacterium]
VGGRAGMQAYTAAGRDDARPAGSGGVRPYLELALGGGFDKVVARSRLAVEPRLSDDPAWPGRRDLDVVGRAVEAYGSAQFTFGSVLLGQLDRQWGPGAEPGAAMSGFRYPRAGVGLELGTRSIRLRSWWTDLRDETDSAGAVVHRYFAAHRLDVRFSPRLTVGLWEVVLIAGRDREFESIYRNPFSLSLLANTYGLGGEGNVMVGIDATWRAADATTLRAQLAVDDVNYLERDEPDRAPDRLALALEARGALGPRASWTALYALATSTAFRAADPFESFIDAGVGLGRPATDYDRLAIRVGLPVGPWLLGPEASLLRQGEGRLTDPYPPPGERGSTPQLFIGTMERTWALAATLDGSAGPLDLAARAGYHLRENAGHLRGATDHRFEGRLQATLRLGRRGALP